MNRWPQTVLFLCCLLTLAGQARPVFAWQESQDLPPLFPKDGVSRQVELPFSPSQIIIADDEKTAIAVRSNVDERNRPVSTRWIAIDLDTMKTSPEVTIPGRILRAACRFPWAAAATSEQKILLFSLPSLEIKAEISAPASNLWIVGDRFLDTGELRFQLSDLKPVTDEWSVARRGKLKRAIPGPEPIWYFGSFLYDNSLEKPIRYVGPDWRPADVITIQKPGRRMSPGLKSLRLVSARSHGVLSRLTTSLAPLGPGQNPWIRFELFNHRPPGRIAPKPQPVQDNLLAAIRVDLPDRDGYRQSDLMVRNPQSIIAEGSDRRFVCTFNRLLMVFEISEECQQKRLPYRGPGIELDSLPVMIGDEQEIKWLIRLENPDDELTALSGSGFTANASEGMLTISGSRLSEQFVSRSLNDWPLFRQYPMSPTATWEEHLALLREKLGPEWEQLEQLAGRKLKGIPLEVPVRFYGTTKGGSRIRFQAGFVVDMHSEKFLALIRKTQAAWMSAITAPSDTADETLAEVSALPIVDGKLQDASLPEVPDTPEPVPELPELEPLEDLPPIVVDIPEIVVEPLPDESVSEMGVEAGANLAVTALLGFLMISLSCRLHAGSRPEDEPFTKPSAARVAVSSLVLSLFVVGLDLPAIAIVRQFVNSDGWHVLPAAAVIVTVSCFARFLLAATGLKFLLKVSGEEILELLLVLSLVSVIPTVGWLAAFVHHCLS